MLVLSDPQDQFLGTDVCSTICSKCSCCIPGCGIVYTVWSQLHLKIFACGTNWKHRRIPRIGSRCWTFYIISFLYLSLFAPLFWYIEIFHRWFCSAFIMKKKLISIQNNTSWTTLGGQALDLTGQMRRFKADSVSPGGWRTVWHRCRVSREKPRRDSSSRRQCVCFKTSTFWVLPVTPFLSHRYQEWVVKHKEPSFCQELFCPILPL